MIIHLLIEEGRGEFKVNAFEDKGQAEKAFTSASGSTLPYREEHGWRVSSKTEERRTTLLCVETIPTPEPISQEQLLKKHGWVIECNSPFEIQHPDGSRATGQAAKVMVEYLREHNEDE